MKNVKLFVVKSEIADERINTMLFNKGTTIEDVIEKYPVLKERKIISAVDEDCEVIPFDNSSDKFQVAYTDLVVDKNGKIIGKTNYTNPNDDELMKITPKDIAEMEENEVMIEFYESLEKGEEECE